MNNVEEILEKAKKNSIGDSKKEKMIKGVKTLSKKTLVVLLTLFLSVSLAACGSYEVVNEADGSIGIVRTEEYVYYSEGVKCASNIAHDVKQILLDYGINPSELARNDISVYEKITELDENDLIGYYRLLGEDECEKILQVLGYKNWNEYLSINGFFSEDGIPSVATWEYETYVMLGQQTELWGHKK